MERLSNKLARAGDGSLWHWCPACHGLHRYQVGVGPGPRWTWNSYVNRPSFEPSMLNFTTHETRREMQPDGTVKLRSVDTGRRIVLCHYFLRNGRLEFCGDNPHALNGQTVDLPDLPEWVGT